MKYFGQPKLTAITPVTRSLVGDNYHATAKFIR